MAMNQKTGFVPPPLHLRPTMYGQGNGSRAWQEPSPGHRFKRGSPPPELEQRENPYQHTSVHPQSLSSNSNSPFQRALSAAVQQSSAPQVGSDQSKPPKLLESYRKGKTSDRSTVRHNPIDHGHHSRLAHPVPLRHSNLVITPRLSHGLGVSYSSSSTRDTRLTSQLGSEKGAGGSKSLSSTTSGSYESRALDQGPRVDLSNSVGHQRTRSACSSAMSEFDDETIVEVSPCASPIDPAFDMVTPFTYARHHQFDSDDITRWEALDPRDQQCHIKWERLAWSHWERHNECQEQRKPTITTTEKSTTTSYGECASSVEDFTLAAEILVLVCNRIARSNSG